MSTLTETDTLNMKQALIEIRYNMMKVADTNHAEYIQQLIDKLESQYTYIAFCGHFSAGKSSLINKLCGRKLLPSSPIPTSANIVSIKDGLAGAYVQHRSVADPSVDSQGSEQPIAVPIPLDELEAYCKNGEDIKSVDIHYPLPQLGQHLALLDTPGIDSTDVAHLQATESALHLADTIFYVTDYNHVQSEINFTFMKRLADWGKPLYVVVNQIDKHRADELPFAEYKVTVEQSFADWHIIPDGFIYLSLKEENHPESEWPKLQWLVSHFKDVAQHIAVTSIGKSADHLIERHCQLLVERNEANKTILRQSLEETIAMDEALSARAHWAAELESIRQYPEALRMRMKREMSTLLENANLIPAQTRDLAHQYLLSLKPGYRRGLLFSNARTKKEIDKRLHAWHQDLLEQVNAHIDWHLRDQLRAYCDPLNCSAEPMLEHLDTIKAGITASWLAEQVNSGTVFSDEYTMTYAKQTSSAVKALYRKPLPEWQEVIGAKATSAMQEKEAKAHIELNQRSSQLAAIEQLEQIEQSELAYENGLKFHLNPFGKDWNRLLPDLSSYRPQLEVASATVNDETSLRLTPSNLDPIAGIAAGSTILEVMAEDAMPSTGMDSHHLRNQMMQSADKLRSAVDILQHIEALKPICRSMAEKAKRMEQSEFTIALFGAFSAGKSSFANALIGESVLPVSPNPTTAAICKIMRPQLDWPHGTAKIRMKSQETILADVIYSLNVLGITVHNPEEALHIIYSLEPRQIGHNGKPHYAFLKAVQQGWAGVEPTLGKEIRADESMFRRYVAEESKSCFVEWIELFYSCPLTDQGVVLVDTPGADSINARHTDVSFEYIKNADAILFVTYYNHAFSQADREFLLQLGRVKDSFELDKMFFVVNAADLATSTQELQEVVQHIETNLLQFGIRHPRIYPLSSQNALEGKQSGNSLQRQQSGISQFEAEFIRFTFTELALIAIHSTEAEINRAVVLLRQWIESTYENAVEKQRRAAEIKQNHAEALTQLALQQITMDHNKLRQEIQQLLYYVKQRILFRFGELYNRAFNPSSLQEDGRNMNTALRTSWFELVRLISFDLTQEILATTLRIENYLNACLRTQFTETGQLVQQILPSYESEALERISYVTPNVSDPLPQMVVEEKLLRQHFKNGKHFFEGRGKSELKDKLEAICLQAVTQFVDLQVEILLVHYEQQYELSSLQVLEHQKKTLNEMVESLLFAFENKVDVADLQQRMYLIQELI